MNSSLIEVEIGNTVVDKYSGELWEVLGIKLVPSSISDPSLVGLLKLKSKQDDRKMVCTSNHFYPAWNHDTYKELYPSVWLVEELLGNG